MTRTARYVVFGVGAAGLIVLVTLGHLETPGVRWKFTPIP